MNAVSDQRDGAHGERGVEPAVQLGLRERAVRRIQKIIQVTKPTATIDISAAEALLRLEAEAGCEVKVSSAPNARLSADGGGDADPDRRAAGRGARS